MIRISRSNFQTIFVLIFCCCSMRFACRNLDVKTSKPFRLTNENKKKNKFFAFSLFCAARLNVFKQTKRTAFSRTQ